MRRSLVLAWLCLLGLGPSACSGRRPSDRRPPPSAATDAAAAERSFAPDASLPDAARKTTDGKLAVENLNAQIQGLEKAAAAQPNVPRHLLQLAPGYAARAQFLGRVSELERALDVTERAVKAMPGDPEALLARAGALAGVHRFSDALAALDAAKKAGADPDALAGARASILEALGDEDAALAIRRDLATRAPTLEHLATLASLEGTLGDDAGAERDFAAALAAYHDVSPFAIAYLEFQRGLWHERAGDDEAARADYQAALARLPAFAAAAGHLAALDARAGDEAHAIQLLEPLVVAADDPEYWGQLAALYRKAGRTADADALLARAKARYHELVARQPAAFADHAARFWLGPGGDVERAFDLASQNLKVRRTDDALVLVIDTALAASHPEAACNAAELGEQRPHAGKAVLAAAFRAYTACKRPDDAARVDARLK